MLIFKLLIADTPKSYKTVAYDERYTFAVPVEFGVKRVGARHVHIIANEQNCIWRS